MKYQYGTHASPQALPADLNTARIAETNGWFLRAHCCRPPQDVKVRYLLDWQPRLPDTLAATVRRLRCRACGAPPWRVELVDYQGEAATRKIDLSGMLPPGAREAVTALRVTGTTWLEPVTARDLARDPAKRRLLGQTFALQGVESGTLFGADSGLHSAKHGTGER